MKQKDTYIGKLENAKETQDRELSYLLATNSDLADQNKVIHYIHIQISTVTSVPSGEAVILVL